MFSCFPCLIFSSTGSLRFTRSHEAALSKLFEELKPILVELKNKEERTFAQRCLKENFMASPHDIRGSRRLSVIFSLMEVKTKIVLKYSFLDSITSPWPYCCQSVIGSNFQIIIGLDHQCPWVIDRPYYKVGIHAFSGHFGILPFCW